MRVLRYEMKIPTFDWLPRSTYDLVPMREITDHELTPKLFDIILAAVKKAKMSYVVFERTETAVEFSGDGRKNHGS